MDVNNRARLERKLAEELSKLGGEQLRKILAAMGDPPDVDNLPEGIWTTWAQDLRDALGHFLLSVAQAQAKEFADGIPQATGTIDWALANREAREWAQAYTFDLVGGIVDHSKNAVDLGLQAVLRTAIGQGAGGERGRWSIADVTDALSPYFGAVRAETIAVTEITRASAEAESRLVDQLGEAGIDLVAFWNTREDELVCPICGDLDTQEADDNGQWVTVDGETIDNPPAHPRCRCFIGHRIVNTGKKSTDPKRKTSAKFTWKAGDIVLGPAPTVKGFNPDQPRDERGRFGEGSGGAQAQDAQATPDNLRGDVGAVFDGAAKQGDAQKVLGDHFDKWAGTLSPVERNALTEYQNSGYGSLNDALRNGSRRGFDLMKESSYLSNPTTGFAETHETFAKVLDGAISRGTVPEDVVVVRGMDLIPDLERLTPGATFMDKAFVSTSAAKGFTDWKPVALELLVPKGSSAAYMPSNMEGENREYDSEKELLLPRGASFQVVSYETVDDSRFALGKSVKIRAIYIGPNKVDPATKAQDVPKHDPKKWTWAAEDVAVAAPGAAKGFNPDQPRDDQGRFGSGGGGDAQGGGRAPGLLKDGTKVPEIEGTWTRDWDRFNAKSFDETKYDAAYADEQGTRYFDPPPLPPGALSGSDAHELLANDMDIRGELTLNHAAAIAFYQSSGAYEMNTRLRDRDKTEDEGANWANNFGMADGAASVLSDAIDRSKTPEDLVVYRGGGHGVFPGLVEGGEIRDRGFVSTSTSQGIGAMFSGQSETEGTLFVITIPKGTNALYVDAIGGDKKTPWGGKSPTTEGGKFKGPVPTAYEREMVLQRGASFRIDKIERRTAKGTEGLENPQRQTLVYATHVGDAGPILPKSTKAADPKPQDRRDKWIWKAGDLVLGAGPLIMGSEAKGAPDQPRDEAGRFAATDGGNAGGAQVDGRVAGSPGKDGAGKWRSKYRDDGTIPPAAGMGPAQAGPLHYGHAVDAAPWDIDGTFDGGEAHSFLMGMDNRGDLSAIHARAIAYYQDTGFSATNANLREGNPEDADASPGVHGIVTILSDAIDRSRVPEDLVVLRGAGTDMWEALADLKPGATFRDKGFVSTTPSQYTADSFADQLNGVQMVLRIPKGTNGLYVDAVAGAGAWKDSPQPKDVPYGGERELILQRGSSFRVDKVETRFAQSGDRPRLFVYATHVGDEGKYVEHGTTSWAVYNASAKAYNPDQPRDELGRFGEGSGGDTVDAQDGPPKDAGPYYGPESLAAHADLARIASVAFPEAVKARIVGPLPREVSATLPQAERQAVWTWGISGAGIREAQRGGAQGFPPTQVDAAAAANFAKALDKYPTAEGTVYRGLAGVPVEVATKWIGGEPFALANDQSATTDNQVAKGFAGTRSRGGVAVTWRIETTTARFVGSETGVTNGGKFEDEAEAVLRKGAELSPVAWRIVDRTGKEDAQAKADLLADMKNGHVRNGGAGDYLNGNGRRLEIALKETKK